MRKPIVFKIHDSGEISPISDFFVKEANSDLIYECHEKGNCAFNILTSERTPCFLYNPSIKNKEDGDLIGVNFGSCLNKYQAIISENIMDFNKVDYYIEYIGKSRRLKKIFKMPEGHKLDLDSNLDSGINLKTAMINAKDCSKIVLNRHYDFKDYLSMNICSFHNYKIVEENAEEEFMKVRTNISLPAIKDLTSIINYL